MFRTHYHTNKERKQEDAHGATEITPNKTEGAASPTGTPGGGTHGPAHHLSGGRPGGADGPAPGEDQLGQILRLARQEGVTPFFLGKGSNLLVADEGVDRFLIKVAGGLDRLERDGGDRPLCGQRVTLAQAAVFAAGHGLTGLEFAHGIPGTLGGGVFMNAGAYDGGDGPGHRLGRLPDQAGKPHRLGKEEGWLWATAAAFSPSGPG